MSGEPHPLLHHAALSVLASQSFSRTSSTALDTMTDILSRYMILLARNCTQHAQNAGRSGVNYFDVVAALEDMGTDIEELKEWTDSDSRLPHKAPAVQDEVLEEWHEFLSEGLTYDPSDRTRLEYGIPPSSESHSRSPPSDASRSVSRSPSPRATVFPLSPVSMSSLSSPPSKRRRLSSPASPDYILSFLPPLPGQTSRRTGHKRASRSASPGFSQPIVGSPLSPIPYGEGAMLDLPHHDLPSSPTHTPPASPVVSTSSLAVALTALSADSASTYVATSNSASRYRLAQLLTGYSSARYNPPDTLFASSDPPMPRHLPPMPTHPTPMNPLGTLPVPPPPSRAVTSQPPIAPAPPYLFSFFPELSRTVLPTSIYNRVTRIPAPTLLQNNEQFLYGNPIPAPWNGYQVVQPNGEKEAIVEDAQLRATWDWTHKDRKSAVKPVPEWRQRA